MGDRAVIGFKADKEAIPVFLYSHWGGSDRFRDTARAITAAEPRWNQADYATRIAISQIVQNYWSEETGFGISAGHNSYSYPDYEEILIIDWSSRSVEVASAGDSTEVLYSIGFEEFCNLPV